MVAKNKRHLLLCILAAHVVCGLHYLCLVQRAFFHFVYATPDSDVGLLRVIDTVILITHLSVADNPGGPCFLGIINTQLLAIVACGCIGYAVGFKIVYLWNHQILSATFTSFIWWLCLAIIVFDIVILVLLMKDPLWSLIAFLKLQVLASIGTAVLFVILGFSQLKTWLQTRLPKGT